MEPAPPSKNRLLALLGDEELRSLEPKLEYVYLPWGHVLLDPGDHVRYLYFPTSGLISILYVNDSGASVELLLVGSDGMVGLSLLLGSSKTTLRAVVGAAGHAFRLRAADAQASFAAGGTFQRVMLWYCHARFLHASQTAICNLHHSVDQHFSRWLLMCLDRLEGGEIRMTQEGIANMLGVRRQGVTEAARKLQERGVISYFRGHITVLDRAALEACACECYEVIKRQVAASLPGLAPARSAVQSPAGRLAAHRAL